MLQGELLPEALAQADADSEVIAVDPSAARLEQLERRARDPRVTFLIGDPEVLPLPDQSVDVVLGNGREPELSRVLRR